MPNWCECELTVEGPEADLARFRAKAIEQNPREGEEPAILDAASFIPYPAKFTKQDAVAERWWQENTEDGKRYGKLKDGVSLRKAPKDGFNSGGYEWCIKNWGTKWGICEPKVVDEAPDCMEYAFECAWGPCTPVIQKMGEMFPMLRFELRYFEGGMGFQGLFVVEDGNVAIDSSVDYAGPRGG